MTQSLLAAFPSNSRFSTGVNGGYRSAGLLTPALAQRGKKINLNYPLPVSNDPNEPIRQKWINDTYQLLKSILPPMAIDTAEELAALSQYVINIVDFRDTDSTMTHWVNPEVIFSAWRRPRRRRPRSSQRRRSRCIKGTPTPTNQLDQWGMEYNPVAINEVLAYSYRYVPPGKTSATAQANRFFVELVNTQTAPEVGTATAAGFNPVVDLGGYVYTRLRTRGIGDAGSVYGCALGHHFHG